MSSPLSLHSNRTRNSSLNDPRRDRLTKLQQREQLKGLLITKFKKKYGNQTSFIQREVQDFMKAESLTQANLRKLDERLKQKSKAQSIRQQARSFAQSRLSVPSSKGSVRSKFTSFRSTPRSTTIQSVSRPSQYIPQDDQAQWAAIMDHDTFLFREEERAKMQRLQQNKMKLKRELDKQLEEKQKRKLKEQEDNRLYDQAYQANLDMMNNREKQKEIQYKQKIMDEKKLRDKQRAIQKRQKRKQDREQAQYDKIMVEKIQEELDDERRMIIKRKRDGIQYAKQLMQENNLIKQKINKEKQKERMGQIRDMKNYARMLDQQQADRQQEIKQREDRQQMLVAKMAGSILKEQHKKNLEQDMMILRYMQRKEEAERKNQEDRMKSRQVKQIEMRRFLDQQVYSKQRRRSAQQRNFNQQGEIWKRAAADFDKEESEKKQRDWQLNQLNAQLLKLQMEEKKARRFNSRQMRPNNFVPIKIGNY